MQHLPYIDSVILRDRDITNAWTDETQNKRQERRYFAQNWRADVSAILTDGGSMVEWVKYSAYGVPFALPVGDTDSDGDWDADDKVRINAGGAYDVRKDPELDGDIDAADVTHADSFTGGGQAMGRGVLSSGGVGGAVSNRRGYAGYEYAPELEGTGAAGRHLYHVRHRLYDADMGRWTRRDPLGYVDGMGLYEYVKGMAVVTLDSMGLFACTEHTCHSCTANTASDARNDSRYIHTRAASTRIPWPSLDRFPCDRADTLTNSRTRICTRWAEQACDTTAFPAGSPCYNKCVVRAATCCSYSVCSSLVNTPWAIPGEASCTRAGWDAGGRCLDNIVSNPKTCVVTCMTLLMPTFCPLCNADGIVGVLAGCLPVCLRTPKLCPECLLAVPLYCGACYLSLLNECNIGCGNNWR